MMRFTFCAGVVLAAAVLAGPASADRIIFAPTGNVLNPGQIKAEGAVGPSNDNGQTYWVGVGMQRIEVSAMRFNKTANLIGASGNIDVIGAEIAMLPETSLTPGFGLGVWDLTKKTPDGRGYYAAFTKSVPLTKNLPLPIHDVKLTGGYGTNGMSGVFGGAEASIPFGFKLSAEYFQKDFNFAVAWKPVPTLQFKVYLLDNDTFYGVQFNPPI